MLFLQLFHRGAPRGFEALRLIHQSGSRFGPLAFHANQTLRPDQAIGEMGKLQWDEVIGLGVTAAGDFEVINSAMTAERALWLIEWAKRWAMGLAIDE